MKKYILEYEHLDEATALLGHEIPYTNLEHVSTIIVELVKEEYTAIKKAGYNIKVDSRVKLLAFPANFPAARSYPTYPTYMDDYYKIKQANLAGFDGTGIKIMLIDSGCQDANAALMNPLKFSRVDVGDGLLDYANPSHGSRGCNIIGGIKSNFTGAFLNIGIAYNAEIISTRCPYSSICITAINYAIANNVDIINVALNVVSGLDTAVAAAISAGIIFIAASGNVLSNNVAHPADITGVLAVNGVAYNNSTVPFGSYITTDGHTQVAVTAYAHGHYEFITGGTSQTSWHVCGLLALYKQKYPSLDTPKAINLLKRRALPMDGFTYSLPSHSSTRDVLENYQTGAGFIAPLY